MCKCVECSMEFLWFSIKFLKHATDPEWSITKNISVNYWYCFQLFVEFFFFSFFVTQEHESKKKGFDSWCFFIMSKKNKHPVIFYTLHICLIFFEGWRHKKIMHKKLIFLLKAAASMISWKIVKIFSKITFLWKEKRNTRP